MPAQIRPASTRAPGARQRAPAISPLSDTVPFAFAGRCARTNHHARYLTAARKLTIASIRVQERSGIPATQTQLLPSAPPPTPLPATFASSWSWSWVGSSADGSLVLPTSTNVFYALHNHHNQHHHQTSSPAICVLDGSGSGGGASGGLHSAALALGWLRALHGLGVLHRAQLLAAGPGLCSWLAAAVCYATQQQEKEQQEGLQCGVEDALGRLLGPLVPPEQCGALGVGAVGSQGGLLGDKRCSLEAALVDPAPFRDSVLGELMKGGGWPAQQAARWSRFMMLAFLEPYAAVGGWAERDHGMATLEATQDWSMDEADGERPLLLPPQPSLPLTPPSEPSAQLCGGDPAGYRGCCSVAGGAGGEATSIHAALEAGAETLIALVPSSVPLGMDNDTYAHSNKELAGLFGRWVDDPTDPRFTPHRAATYNARTQVFPSPAFDDLLAALRARYSAGGPAVHVVSYTLEPNSSPHSCCADPRPRYPGPRRVRVVWVVNAEHGSWEGRLPWHVRFELHTDRRLAQAGMLGGSVASMDDQQQQQGQQQQQQWCDSLHDFPYCASLASTRVTAAASASPSLTPSTQLVSLLAHHAAGMVEGAREQLREAGAL